uniref:histidine phosphatase family protein n=1 Tax=Lactobacillus acidophilus TaxID=1579 RepID=UPI003F574777
MKLILVRHGISEHNVGNIVSGSKSDPELSKDGIINTKNTSQFIDEAKIDQIYSSPLTRAYQTAQILTNGNKTIRVDKRIVEMNFGDWDGKETKPIYDKYPDAFDYTGAFSPNFIKYDKGAESYDDLIDRCNSFMHDLKKKSAGQTVLVVCHGFTIRGILADLFHTDITSIAAVNNVSFTEISFDEQHFWAPRLISFNREKPAYFAVK